MNHKTLIALQISVLSISEKYYIRTDPVRDGPDFVPELIYGIKHKKVTLMIRIVSLATE